MLVILLSRDCCLYVLRFSSMILVSQVYFVFLGRRTVNGNMQLEICGQDLFLRARYCRSFESVVFTRI